MKIQKTKLADIKPYFNNPRDNSAAIAPVIESIKRYGFVKPILCDKDGVIIAGHTRYLASVQMGLEYVPVIYSDMSGEEAQQYRIADNKLAEKSFYDDDMLLEELKKLQVPTNLQAFFFEDIDTMLNFSYSTMVGQPTSSDFNPEDGDGGYPSREEVGMDYSEDDYPEDEFPEDAGARPMSGMDLALDNAVEEGVPEELDENENLYKVRLVDGKKMMTIICPYCGNKEEVEL